MMDVLTKGSFVLFRGKIYLISHLCKGRQGTHAELHEVGTKDAMLSAYPVENYLSEMEEVRR